MDWIDEIEKGKIDEKHFYESAYYYAIEKTGIGIINDIASRVNQAGKMYHHTDGWNDEYNGVSPVTMIQDAINEAAEGFKSLISEVRRLQTKVTDLETAIGLHKEMESRLKKENEGLREDQKRLDWLESHKLPIAFSNNNELIVISETFRAAIDAEMKEAADD